MQAAYNGSLLNFPSILLLFLKTDTTLVSKFGLGAGFHFITPTDTYSFGLKKKNLLCHIPRDF